jgi:hypothetical protein
LGNFAVKFWVISILNLKVKKNEISWPSILGKFELILVWLKSCKNPVRPSLYTNTCVHFEKYFEQKFYSTTKHALL